jgi:transcriptional regulator with XRE-family HTH domain
MATGTGQSLGGLLLRFRIQAGMTQEELSGSSGLSVRSISDLERDKVARPRRRSLELLVTALRLDQAQQAALFGLARGIARDPAGQAGSGTPGAGGKSAPNGWLPPRQLPRAPAGFSGRAAELATIGGTGGPYGAPCPTGSGLNEVNHVQLWTLVPSSRGSEIVNIHTRRGLFWNSSSSAITQTGSAANEIWTVGFTTV